MSGRFLMALVTRIVTLATGKFDGDNIQIRMVMYTAGFLVDRFSEDDGFHIDSSFIINGLGFIYNGKNFFPGKKVVECD